MKKILAIALMAAVVLAGCKDDEDPVIKITKQPTAPTGLTEGNIPDDAKLEVEATVTEGAKLNYQWYESTSTSTADGTAITSATSPSYALPDTLKEGTYYYYAELSASGAQLLKTNVVTVTVGEAGAPAPVITITAQPVAPEELLEGAIPEDAELTVVATASDEDLELTFKWYGYDPETNELLTAIEGATEATYTLPTDLIEGEYWYVCEVSAEGAESVQTDPLEVVVAENPDLPVPVITIETQPEAPAELTAGSIPADTKLIVEAEVTENATLTYQWYIQDPAAEEDEQLTAIEGATEASYTLPTDLAAGDHWYVCEISTRRAESVKTEPVKVTVVAAPVPVITITTQPEAPEDELVAGSIPADTKLTVVAEVTLDADPTYQWYKYDAEAEEDEQLTAIEDATEASYTLPTDLTAGVYQYVCKVSAEGAEDVKTEIVDVTVVEAAEEEGGEE